MSDSTSGTSADVRSVADDATAATKPQSAHVKPEGQKPDSRERGERKIREGLVVSDKMDKTVVVELEDRVKHPLYGKVMRRTSKVKAHDEENTAGVGDRVRLMETRPLSATKRWRLTEILEKAK
jgi:small subunit ribosomal protein S17